MKQRELLSAEDQRALDELIAEQAREDCSYVRHRDYVSLDMPVAMGEGTLRLGDLLSDPLDFSPFGELRRLMEQNVENTIAAAKLKNIKLRVGIRNIVTNGAKMHCKRGHELNERNTRLRHYQGQTWRICRVCHREQQRHYREGVRLDEERSR